MITAQAAQSILIALRLSSSASVEEIPQGLWRLNGSLKLSATDQSSSLAGRPITSKAPWALVKLWRRKEQDLQTCETSSRIRSWKRARPKLGISLRYASRGIAPASKSTAPQNISVSAM